MKNHKFIHKALRTFRRSSIPLALVASCGLIALLGADRWISHNLDEQRKIDFQNKVKTISLELNENILISNYNNIDNLLLRILEEDTHIRCLVVTGHNGKILSIAARTKPGFPAYIQYGEPPKACKLDYEHAHKESFSNKDIHASIPIQNNNLILGRITGHADIDENALTRIRTIELILFGAFGAAFLPAFGVLSWSSNRQLELEQEKTARVSGLISQLKEAQIRTRAAFEGTNDGWLEWNVRTDECTPSAKMKQLIGLQKDEKNTNKPKITINQYWQQLAIKSDQEKLNFFLDKLRHIEWGNKSMETPGIEVRIKPINSQKILTLKLEAVATEITNKKASAVAIVANNITHDKEQQERINHLAFYDTLTGLRNRYSFSEQLKISEHGLKRNEYRLAIYAIDIDNFKFLNDSHGHSSGDQFLIQVANRIKSCTRKNDFIARLGGDEFVIIYKLPNKSAAETKILIKRIAEKLLKTLSQPYVLTNCTAYNTCSIGICVDNIDDNSAATLLDKADIALYKAKEKGRNCFFTYQSGMASEVFSKAATAENLKNLIEAGKTSLYLQPIVRLSGNQNIVGYEALFRCKSLTKSIQYLISCAEEAGIIHLVTESILNGIQMELKSNNYDKDAYVSINISPVQFLEFDFPSKFLDQLHTRKIDPKNICIEITETAVLEDTSRALDHMTLLKMAGVKFSLDDFGTGYSSIELLRKLPFTSIKIDRSYIQNIDQDSGMKLVESIINMAKAFNMELIGEGVETIGQKHTLSSLGCECAQGYLFNNNGKTHTSS